ncbi:zinc-binding alcohol dehydrogenase family protein [Pelagovum pacificum]|uniref:Zinc-binding alcohol dehydrogenase family protein n=1 Tax=Pelagovum pacificum TaxID=2588711 RepID=A0A5C5GEP5_9RHOB|nr:zinc-binding alcohol dehydrogenase family protein [Pelagovum pacificum]QQA44466.1 zinc-binding alcohol dehydrogenase family protein [Pelagovum pacificum]TNY32419.1 zinc-binding alcohol dehydrogenase family protein [Pelagovum pacificum]
MSSNYAAWLTVPHGRLTVSSAPLTPPERGQIRLKARAVAINPIDRFKQKMGKPLYGWRAYPMVLGFDLAGEVESVGPGVTRFAPGDRVVSLAVGMEKSRNRDAEAAFQLFTNVRADLSAPIPDHMSFEEAAVLPLALSTAACGLFGADQLNLPRPGGAMTDQGRTVLVWGGSTSVGCCAIQLAKAAGYRVVTSASPRNFDYLERLGADVVLDYAGPDAARRVAQALAGHSVAGAIAMGEGSSRACIDVLGTSEGTRKVAMATFPVDLDALPDAPGPWTLVTQMLPRMMTGMFGLWVTAKRRGVAHSTIWGTSLMETDLGPAIFENFLPQALASGQIMPAPPPLVVGDGLEAIQSAFDRQRQGVSARKVVVTL